MSSLKRPRKRSPRGSCGSWRASNDSSMEGLSLALTCDQLLTSPSYLSWRLHANAIGTVHGGWIPSAIQKALHVDSCLELYLAALATVVTCCPSQGACSAFPRPLSHSRQGRPRLFQKAFRGFQDFRILSRSCQDPKRSLACLEPAPCRCKEFCTQSGESTHDILPLSSSCPNTQEPETSTRHTKCSTGLTATSSSGQHTGV